MFKRSDNSSPSPPNSYSSSSPWCTISSLTYDVSDGFSFTHLQGLTCSLFLQLSQSSSIQGGQKQDNCLTINFAVENEKIEYKLLESEMVAHAKGLERTTDASSICQNFLLMWAFLFLYMLATRVDSFSVRTCTHCATFWSSWLGFKHCSFLRAVLITAPAPSHSPIVNTKAVSESQILAIDLPKLRQMNKNEFQKNKQIQ
jgi:hypothetical protein